MRIERIIRFGRESSMGYRKCLCIIFWQLLDYLNPQKPFFILSLLVSIKTIDREKRNRRIRNARKKCRQINGKSATPSRAVVYVLFYVNTNVFPVSCPIQTMHFESKLFSKLKNTNMKKCN